YALAQLWLDWGVPPAALLGHSVGEYVAACLAGVFSLEDALALIAKRGALVQAQPGGAMMAVGRGGGGLRGLLPEALDVAAVNGPGQCVVAGPTGAIDAFAAELEKRKLSARRLATSHAFHCQLLEPVLPEFAAAVRQVKLNAPRLPFLSGLT